MKIETTDILIAAVLAAGGYFAYTYFSSKSDADKLTDPRFQSWVQNNPAPDPNANPQGWQAWLDRALALLQVLFPDGIKIGQNQFGNLLRQNPQLDASGRGFGLETYRGGFNSGQFNFNPFGGFSFR